MINYKVVNVFETLQTVNSMKFLKELCENGKMYFLVVTWVAPDSNKDNVMRKTAYVQKKMCFK